MAKTEYAGGLGRAPDAPNRERYVEQWSDVISTRAILTYDYLAVKQRFQERARESIDRGHLKQDVDRTVQRHH